MPRSPLFLKVYPGRFVSDSRDERDFRAASDSGFDTVLVAVEGSSTDRAPERWQWLGTRPLGTSALGVRAGRAISVLTWAAAVRRARPDVVSGHNLIGLFIGWLSGIGLSSSRRPLLVYDAHEFTVGQHTGLQRRVVSALEGFLMRRAVFSIVVNDAIADEVQRLHGLKERPVVVRSTPDRWELDAGAIQEHRREYLAGVVTEEDAFVLMYHGGVLPHRGIELSMRVLQDRPGVVLVVLGDAQSEAYESSLKDYAVALGVEDRVLFLPAVPLSELGNYVAAADVGMVVLEPVNDNHRMTLPNKFFENIQSLTPVVVSDFPAISPIVREYDIGLTVDPTVDAEIGAAVDRLRYDPEFYARLKQNLATAKDELCWENEKQELEAVYRKILEQRE